MNKKGLNFKKRFAVAVSGLCEAWAREKSFRFHVFAAIALLVFCVVVRPSFQWCAIFAAMAVLVLSTELVNSGIEALLDRLHPEEDLEVKFIKDCLAGAVLVTSLGSVIIFCFFLAENFSI